MRLSQRLSTAESIQKGPSESSSAATYPEKSAKAQSRHSVSMRDCAFFSPCLTPVWDRGKGHEDTVVSPEMPTRRAGGHAIVDHESSRQIHHAVGGVTARWRQSGEVRMEVRATLGAVMLRRGHHKITRTPHVESAQVVQRPMRRLVPIGRVTTARTRLPHGVATLRDDLGLRQGCGHRDPFARVGSVCTWTAHRVALLAQRFGPELYDKHLLGATRCPRYSLAFDTVARTPGYFHPARALCKAWRVCSRPSPWASRPISSAMRAVICSWVRTL